MRNIDLVRKASVGTTAEMILQDERLSAALSGQFCQRWHRCTELLHEGKEIPPLSCLCCIMTWLTSEVTDTAPVAACLGVRDDSTRA